MTAAASTVVRLRGISIGASRGGSPCVGTSPSLLSCRRHISAPFHDCYQARHQLCRLVPLNRFGSRKTSAYGNAIVAWNYSLRTASVVPERSGFSSGSDFGRSRARFFAPGATAVSDYGSRGKRDAAIIFKEFLIDFLQSSELRCQWVRLVAVVAIVTLVGVLAWSSLGSLSAFLSLGVVILTFGLANLKEVQHTCINANEQLQNLTRAIWKQFRDSPKIFGSVFSSRCPGGAQGKQVANIWTGGYLFSFFQSLRIPRSSSYDGLVAECKPNKEIGMTNIAQCVAHLESLVTSEVVFGEIQSLSGIISRIEDLRRDLLSVQLTLIAKESKFSHSKPNSVTVVRKVTEAQDNDNSGSLDNDVGVADSFQRLTASNLVDYGGPVKGALPIFHHSKPDELVQTNRTLSVGLILGEEACETLSLEGSVRASNPETVEETLAPLVLGISASSSYKGDKEPAADGIMVGESSLTHYHEEATFACSFGTSGKKETNLSNWTRSMSQSAVEMENSSFTEDELVKEIKIPDVISTHTGEGNFLFNQTSRDHDKEVPMVQRIRSSSPDPWRNDSTHSLDPKALVDHERAAPSEKGAKDDSRLLDLVLIVGQDSEAHRKDWVGTGKGVHAYGSVDFWGKTSGSITKSEQRGSLAIRKATGRGSLGSVDDVEDDWYQDRRRRPQEEQRQFSPRDLPSRAGQQWDGPQPGAAGREDTIDEELGRDETSTDDYGRGKAYVRAQTVRPEKELYIRKNGPFVDRERWMDDTVSQSSDIADGREDLVYPGSVGSRSSPQERTSASSVPAKSREREEGTLQATDESNFRREGRDANGENYGGPNGAWDIPQNSHVTTDRGPEIGSQGRRTSADLKYSQSQSEMNDRTLTLLQSSQSRSQKFEGYLDEGQALLEEGMQGLEGNIEVGVAERLLYEGAKRFERAAEMDPASLTAVGLWGNILLVHGQLKLKLSKQLRSMLPPTNTSPLAGVSRDNEQESLELALQDVCEECEDLLVDAGRKYRRALSLDRSDVRALYNWGLALCYRGQLIAEEEGERAMLDADKLYLAAIDKFEAMLGLGQNYAPGALLNWGLAMRDRSRLRAMEDKERAQLLLQAKDLFMDAVRLDPKYVQARGAVAACDVELAELKEFGSLQRQIDSKGRPTLNWWQRGV